MPDLNDAPREVVANLKPNAADVSNTSNTTSALRKTHPMLIIAAGAVTLFCAVGIAMMTGILPSANSVSGANNGVAGGNSKSALTDTKQEASIPLTAAAAGAASAGVGAMMEAPASTTSPITPPITSSITSPIVAQAPQVQPIESKTVGQPLAKADQMMAANKASVGSSTSTSTPMPIPRPTPRLTPRPTLRPTPTPAYSNPDPFPNTIPSSSNERGSVQNSAPGNSQPTPVYAQNSSQNNRPPDVLIKSDNAPKVVASICRSCGRVDSIIPIEKAGEGSGAGALLGGVLGGVLGHQVGNGRGRDAATVVGAVGGAVLGNQVEANNNTSRSYDVRVRMEDNSFRTVRYDVEPNVRVGDKVRLEGSRLVRN